MKFIDYSTIFPYPLIWRPLYEEKVTKEKNVLSSNITTKETCIIGLIGYHIYRISQSM